jgi:hypothetical protein
MERIPDDHPDKDLLRKDIDRRSASIAKANEALIKEQNLVQSKENAYWRKVETENMRQHLQDVKGFRKEIA